MTGSYIQVPPNSTGSKVATEERSSLYFDQKTGDINFGDIITGSTSGVTGTITGLNLDAAGTAGELFMTDSSGTFLNNEDIQIDGLTVAVVDIDTDTQKQFETQKMVISDPDNPNQMQKIDRFGATVNTFTDGAPVFGSFGSMTVGERQAIKDYRFAYDDLDTQFETISTGGGTHSFEALTGVCLASCNTASGAIVKRTSHFYHPYAPGNGHYIQITARLGDTGKLNCRRRWGYFDDRNGVFFEHDGTDFYVVMRSDVTGSVIDTRVIQSDFSNDQLNGTDTIDFTIDLSKPQIYWIDLQWLGTGRVRWGVMEPKGEQIVAHVMQSANTSNNFPYMRTATLPIRWEQENTAATGSTSEFRVNCLSVKHSSKHNIVGERYAQLIPFRTITGTDGWVPLFSARCAALHNGITNRGIIRMKSISLANMTVAGNPKIVSYRIRQAPDSAGVTGGSWAAHGGGSMTEENKDLTDVATSYGMIMLTYVPGTSDLVQAFGDAEVHELELYNNADGITQPIFFVDVKMDDGLVSDTARVGGGVAWEEILG